MTTLTRAIMRAVTLIDITLKDIFVPWYMKVIFPDSNLYTFKNV